MSHLNKRATAETTACGRRETQSNSEAQVGAVGTQTDHSSILGGQAGPKFCQMDGEALASATQLSTPLSKLINSGSYELKPWT